MNLALRQQPPGLLEEEGTLGAKANLSTPPWNSREPSFQPDLLPCPEVGHTHGQALTERPGQTKTVGDHTLREAIPGAAVFKPPFLAHLQIECSFHAVQLSHVGVVTSGEPDAQIWSGQVDDLPDDVSKQPGLKVIAPGCAQQQILGVIGNLPIGQAQRAGDLIENKRADANRRLSCIPELGVHTCVNRSSILVVNAGNTAGYVCRVADMSRCYGRSP